MGDQQQPGPPAAETLKVVLSYAAFAGLWILLSDRAVEWLFSDPALITLASTLKGWVFVAVTSLLLYGLMRRAGSPVAGPAAPAVGLRSLALPAGLLAAAILSLTAGGIVATLRHQAATPRSQALADALWIALAGLLAIAVAVAGVVLLRQRRLLADTLRERAAREEKLRALRLLEAIAENSADAIFAKDLQGRYLLFNKEAARVTGKRAEEVLGRDDTALFSPAEAQFLMDIGRRVMAEDRAILSEETLTTVEGTSVFSSIKGPLHDAEGKVVGLYGISRDITGSKRAEEEKARLEAQLLQAQKMESVGRLAGGVAHDFNNMLLVIMGHAALALERVGPGQPLHADLTEILHAAQRSADLTRQLLAFARRQTAAPRVLDLNHTVEGLLSMLRRLIGEDIDLAWRPGERLWPVRMDPAQIDQVLVNLCVNARDAVAGVGRIAIETGNVSLDEAFCAHHLGSAPGDYVLLTVSDDGSGMSREVLDHLFEPFFTTKGAGQGTGLGLATVYGIVKQNEGCIDVCSQVGAGTTVRIYLPRCLGCAVDEPEARALEPPSGRGETVLLVEDEASILSLGAAMLRRLGYTVLTAGTAEEALRSAAEHAGELRLLITDVVMPGMNGRELARRLAAGRPGLKVLYMSGYTADVIAHRGVLEEGVHFLQKPFPLRDLAVKVREALGAPGGGQPPTS